MQTKANSIFFNELLKADSVLNADSVLEGTNNELLEKKGPNKTKQYNKIH